MGQSNNKQQPVKASEVAYLAWAKGLTTAFCSSGITLVARIPTFCATWIPEQAYHAQLELLCQNQLTLETAWACTLWFLFCESCGQVPSHLRQGAVLTALFASMWVEPGPRLLPAGSPAVAVW